MSNVGTNGELNTDSMLRALLVQRNTPDPDCRLSPAQILFGQPLRDSLPYVPKGIETFCNPQIRGQWRDAWRLKEQAMKARYVKTLENLGEHCRPLDPLNVGDSVFIQNQRGHHPTKWDRSGIVTEVRNHDQYLVKVSGTGRVTLRNRRFLRKFSPYLQPATAEHMPTPYYEVSHQQDNQRRTGSNVTDEKLSPNTASYKGAEVGNSIMGNSIMSWGTPMTEA